MFVINETKKEMLLTLVGEGKNCLITGATGTGKTTLCFEVAESLGLNPVVINCGSTQDARSSLLGYFTLKDGSTVFEDSDFLRSVQEPNTLIILDELSRASDDAYNIIFPVLDFRRNIRVDEKEGEGRMVEVDSSVRFIATANVGLEYSSTRSIDRALCDRFRIFNLEYIKGKQLKKYIKSTEGKDISSLASPLLSLYDYSHLLFEEGKIATRISTRAILESLCLLSKFKMKDIVDFNILSIFEQDSTSIASDSNILREYADSIGIYNED